MFLKKKILLAAALMAVFTGSATAQYGQGYNPFTDDASRRANANRTQVSNPQYDARYNARGNYNNNVTYDRWGNPIYNRGNSNNRTYNNNGRAVQLGPVRLNY